MAVTISGTDGISGDLPNIKVSNGTAAAPALTGQDTDSGFFFGTNEVNISTGGSTRATVNSSGQIGIGTTSPTKPLTIDSDTDQIRLADGSGGFELRAGNIFKLSDDGTERLRVDGSGNLGLGGTPTNASDHKTLSLFGAASNGAGFIEFNDTSGNADAAIFADNGNLFINADYDNTTSSSQIIFRIDGSTQRARLTSTGDWQTFSSNVNIDIANSQSSGNNEAYIYARYGSTGLGAGTLSFRVYTNGNVQNTNNSYGSISDQNLKENIVDATSQWDDIKALQVRKYNFRENTGHQTHTQLGLIAQEVETVSPGLVETTDVREGETVLDADGNQLESIKSINYSVLYMKAVKALQEAQTRIETLETKVAALEAAE
jgi:chaperonin cofactor prefoldin